MKNAKLELLLNKVVEFYQPDAKHFKGFLYRSGSEDYYIKVVDVILDIKNTMLINDVIYLKNGDEQFIIQADKPKLMRVSLKSWHYKLMKFVLGDNTPTPKNMQNGCPYFWLLVLSMLALPFVLIGHGFKGLFLGVIGIIRWSLKSLVNGWLNSLDDVVAYEIYWRGNYGGGIKMPATAKLYFKNDNDDFLDYFLNEKYKLTSKLSPEEYQAKKKEMSDKWNAWTQEMKIKRDKEREEAYERSVKENERIRIQTLKREANKRAWDARMKPIEDGLGKLFTSIANVFSSIGKAFTLSADWKVLIRRTKQVVGAIVTLLILGLTYFLVNIIAYALIAFVDFSISHWEIYAGIVILAAIVGIGYVLYVIVGSWLQGVINRYESGKRVWYIEPLIYLIWYPVKYIAIVIAYGALYVLWVPVKFFFYTFLWNIVIVNTGKFLWKLISSFGKGLANSTGVFGEYFGASYSDYCPGIEWVDTEEEQK
jgi:hypothetical protein